MCGCVNIDPTTFSVYLAKSPGMRMYAFSASGCVPGKDKENFLGEIGNVPPCKDVYKAFDQAPVQSILLKAPLVCDVGEFFKDLFDMENLKNVLDIAADAV